MSQLPVVVLCVDLAAAPTAISIARVPLRRTVLARSLSTHPNPVGSSWPFCVHSDSGLGAIARVKQVERVFAGSRPRHPCWCRWRYVLFPIPGRVFFTPPQQPVPFGTSRTRTAIPAPSYHLILPRRPSSFSAVAGVPLVFSRALTPPITIPSVLSHYLPFSISSLHRS